MLKLYVIFLLVFISELAFGNEIETLIREKYQKNCKIVETCEDMFYVDCNSIADGPAYYLNSKLEVIGVAGGLYMKDKPSGPPKEWSICMARKNKEVTK